MKPTIVFRLHDETEFPQDLIDEAPRQGPFDDYADWILSTYEVDVSLKDSIAYLKRLGAWSLDELQDLDINKARLLWVSILDCKDQGTNYWYMGD